MAGQQKQKGAKGGKKTRKYGRNEAKCKRYADRGTREKNKERKLKKHIAEYPNDNVAKKALLTAHIGKKKK